MMDTLGFDWARHKNAMHMARRHSCANWANNHIHMMDTLGFDWARHKNAMHMARRHSCANWGIGYRCDVVIDYAELGIKRIKGLAGFVLCYSLDWAAMNWLPVGDFRFIWKI